jgi:hypothetical protein
LGKLLWPEKEREAKEYQYEEWVLWWLSGFDVAMGQSMGRNDT